MGVLIQPIISEEELERCLGLLELHYESAANPFRATLSPDWREIWRKAMQASLKRPDHHNLLLTAKEEQAAGVLMSWIRPPGMLVNQPTLIISELFIEEASRRKGLARLLVESAQVWAFGRGVERVEIQTPCGSEGQHFWARLGFAPTTVSMVRSVANTSPTT